MDDKKKIYIILAVFLLADALLAAFVIWPLFSDIEDNSQQLVSIKSNTVALEVQNTEIEDFKKVYNDYKPNLDNANKFFIDPQDPVDFIKFLEKTASDSSIVAKISLSQSSGPDSSATTSFRLSCTDDFLKILDFTEKIERGPYLVEVENMSIKNSTEQIAAKSPSSTKVDVILLINVFKKQ